MHLLKYYQLKYDNPSLGDNYPFVIMSSESEFFDENPQPVKGFFNFDYGLQFSQYLSNFYRPYLHFWVELNLRHAGDWGEFEP
jgi:hypothetical protein